MEFSVAGCVVALLIFAPTLVLLVAPPRGGGLPVSGAGPIVVLLERSGQAACLALLVFSGATLSLPPVDGWLVVAVVAILAYWTLWLRYLITRDAWSLFAPFARVPIPMALLPVVAFAAAAGWARSPWLLGASVVLAAAHWTISWKSYALLRAERHASTGTLPSLRSPRTPR
ncbi:MAG: hypothetical protein ABWY68_03445 [Cryobacterium sp.]